MMEGEESPLQKSQEAGTVGNESIVPSADVDNRDESRRTPDDGVTPTYRDHFMLHHPTSDVRFRGNSVHVYELRSSQIQLATETRTESGEDELELPEGHGNTSNRKESYPLAIEMKEVPADRASALSLLRATYTLVALFFAGIVSLSGPVNEIGVAHRPRVLGC
jgi:hypothetical protein